MISDLVFAGRGLRRSPAFTVAAVVTLALGIGANTTMFSIVNAVLLRPLPGYQTDRLVRIFETGRPGLNFLPPEVYLRLRRAARSFAPIAANQNCRMNLTGLGEPEQLAGPCATANWFDLQRAQALLGRTFLPDEDQHGRNKVVVLDYGYWQRRFGGDPNIIGKTLLLDKEPWVVIGVMRPDFKPAGMDVAPVYTAYVVADNPHGLNVTARLKPGVSLAAAQAELNVLSKQFARQNPEWKDLRLEASPLLEQVTGPQRPLLLLLLGAVSLVLLIACVNVAGLMLARSAARRREIDTRLALGATPAQIVRFVLAEACLLSAAAGVAAVTVAYASLPLLKPLTARLPRADELNLDARVLLCAMTLAALSAILFGGLPALRSSRPAQWSGMRATVRSQRWLVAGEVALAFVLLVGAGLVIRTFVAIRAHDLGYDPHQVLTNFVELPPSADGSRTAGAALFQRIRQRLAALPGVREVATASSIPMFGVSMSMTVEPEGAAESPHKSSASVDVVSDAYFRVLRIPLRAGRSFTPEDRDGSRPVAVVSESVASRYFAGHATGRRILVPEIKFNIDGGKEIAAEIVGVAGNVCVHSVEDCQAEHIYLPESQNVVRMVNLLIRTAGEPRAAASAVRRAVYQEAPAIPLNDPQTLEERTAYLTDGPKRAMWLLGAFAALALALAAVGIYGVSACLAAQRRREIGIRMALGAGFRDIAGGIYRGVLLPAACGLAIGIGVSSALTRLLQSLLFGASPAGPRALASAALALLGVAVLAATIPAVRAAGTDPAEVLRRD